jgi:NAD(P)-dependent dehydrogenase (short-subunit alcohol dehydrogenase family)
LKNNDRIRVFRDAVAIVTGAASGIGRAMAEELARRGADVVLADLQEEAAAQVADGIRGQNRKAAAVFADVTDFDSLQRIVASTVREKGRLDYMFNNAGIAIGGDASLFSTGDWNRIIDVNLRGVTNGVQAVYKTMIRQGFGHIVNTASLAGLVPTPGISAYAMTKHAVVGLSKSLRVEAAFFGVRVSVLCPGIIRTAILEGGGKYGKMLSRTDPAETLESWEKLRPIPADRFARKALDRVSRNRAVILIPGRIHLLWWIDRFSPSLGIRLVQSFYAGYRDRLR